MNLNEFQNNEIDNTNLVNPNIRKRVVVSQENSNNASSQKRIVTPQQMGFTHEEPEKIRPEDPILDNLDKAIARKQREARLLASAIEESDGEGISEDEFQDLLVQARDEIEDDGVPVDEDEEDYEKEIPRKSSINMIPNENRSKDLMDELEAELEQDEVDYAKELKANTDALSDGAKTYTDYGSLPSSATEWYADSTIDSPKSIKTIEIQPIESAKYDAFSDFESSDINFDKENEDLEDNLDEQAIAEKEEKEQMDKLKVLIRQKISPVTKKFDISTYSISKRPAANTISTPRDRGQKIADWVLMNSQRPIYMRSFTGSEMQRLYEDGRGRTNLNNVLDHWKLIYDHIIDPDKPATLEEWAKTTSFLDMDHIYMAIYRANFEGTNFIPYNCTNDKCNEMFLSDNFNIMDMCKFENKEAKAKFDSIIGTELSSTPRLYSTEIVPVSDELAFVFKEPSLYNVIFEPAMLEDEFVQKFGELATMCTYIDEIYVIDHENQVLQPVRTNVYPNNMKKTIKSRIINFSKHISGLNPDQYNTIAAYMTKINDSAHKLTYKLPEVTCPKCKTVIESDSVTAQNLVFTRHRLAALAVL